MRALRLIPAAWLFVIGLLGATAVAAQGEAPEWSLKVWPGQATILATREIDNRQVVLRTIQCTNGVRDVVSRRFLRPDDRNPAGAKPCGAYCRLRMAQTLPRGTVVPDRYTEVRQPMRALRRTLAAELAAEVAAEPWRDRDSSRLGLLLQMAEACHLDLPATIAEGHWSPVSPNAVVRGPALPIIHDLPPRSRAARPVTRPTSAGAINEPLVLRIIGAAPKGSAAVSLRDEQGGSLSPEALLSPADGTVALYFELGPRTPPARVVVRNNDDDAEASAFLVRRIDVAPKSRFDKDDLVELAGAMSGQATGRPFTDIPPALAAEKEAGEPGAPVSRSARP